MKKEDVGMMIMLRRQAAGLNQRELGEKIGKDARSVSSYESGETDIKLSVLCKIAEALGTTVPGLLTGEKKPQKRSTEIRVYQLEDRMAVAQILVKNGYTVSQVKRSREGQKVVEYRLKLEENEDNIRIVK